MVGFNFKTKIDKRGFEWSNLTLILKRLPNTNFDVHMNGLLQILLLSAQCKSDLFQTFKAHEIT